MTKTTMVGIDLGSCYARVCCNGQILSNPQGHRFTPTVCCKVDDAFVIGEAIKQQQQQATNDNSLIPMHKQLGSEESIEFIRYLIQMAIDATSSPVHQVRIVWNIPNHIHDDIDTDIYKTKLRETTQIAIRGMIESKSLRKQEFCIGMIHDSTAVCLALQQEQQQQQAKKKGFHVLVMDGGASGIKLTFMNRTTLAGLWMQQGSSVFVKDVSGPILTSTLAKFVSQQFERQMKIRPSGEVWENSKKARMKLIKEASMVLQQNSSSNMRFVIDGLYDGIDCHVTVSKPRWDMMTSSLKRKVETAMKNIMTHQQDLDAVYLSGALASWLEPIASSVVGKDKVIMKKHSGVMVSPEELIAYGCYVQCQAMTSSSLSNEELDSFLTTNMNTTTHLQNVSLSPVCIAMGPSTADNNEDGDKMTTLIPIGSPLPAHVLTKLQTTNDCSLWQLFNDKNEPNHLATLQLQDEEGEESKDFDKDELVLELTIDGQLKVSVGGGPILTL